MKALWMVAKKEFANYFTTPTAYVFIITFIVVTHWLFFRTFFVIGQADLRALFAVVPWIFLIFVPAVAMGKWSEEKKAGTDELLLTMPISDATVVIAKFLASLSLIAITLALTWTIPLTIMWVGPLDWGPVIGGYLGLLFLGASFLALGLFVSALTENQIVAFIISVVAGFIFFVVGQPFVVNELPSWLARLCQHISLSVHFKSIGRGIIDSRDVIFYLSFIGFFLFCNYKAIESRSWK